MCDNTFPNVLCYFLLSLFLHLQYPNVQNFVQADVSLEQIVKDIPSNSLPESRGKNEEPLSLSTRKKVTFDTNVTTYEHVQVYDIPFRFRFRFRFSSHLMICL